MGTRAESVSKSSRKPERQAALDRALTPRALNPRAQKPAEKQQLGKRKPIQTRLTPEPEPNWVCGWDFELAARAEGARLVAGVDEVGRGPLFGPVVAAAVILPAEARLGTHLDGLNDSKQLCEADRERYDVAVRRHAVAWAVAEVDVATIDRINILQASRLAMRLALESLGVDPDCILIDGNQRIDYGVATGCRQTTIVQGDARSMSIAAASVIAKVHRDRLICRLDTLYPGYGLASNKGYATPHHREALIRLGPTPHHRRSFAPVAALLDGELDAIAMAEAELDLDLFEE
jgi:ribonuclease HII